MAYDSNLALMVGSDIPIPELQLIIHQPKIKEIALIGETDFFQGIQCLTVDKDILQNVSEKSLETTSNFEIFIMLMNSKETTEKRSAVLQVLSLLLPDNKVSFTPRAMLLINRQTNESLIIDTSNFNFLQNIVKDIFCMKNQLNTTNFNPGSKKAKEIADKLMRARQRVAAQNGNGGGSIFVQYVSTLSVALGSMSLNDCLNLTMYQMFDLVERYTLWMSWDLDVKTRLAGGKPDSKPDNWMKNIH